MAPLSPPPMFKRFLAVAMLALAASCKDQAPEPPTITGRWLGSTDTQLHFTFVLNQSGTDVSGNGTVVTGGESVALTISGSYQTPQVSINGSSDNFETFNFSGTHAGTRITGTLNGSGFTNRALILTKQ